MESVAPFKSLVDQAYDVILDAVRDGTFKPGERLAQEDIAARLNVSRQPVTQALTVLKLQGFLAQSERRGVTVTEIEPSFCEAIYQFRSVIDPLAVELATLRITGKTIVHGRSILEHGRNMVVASDVRASLRADMDFHSFIYDLSGSPIISETMRLHWQHLRRAVGQVLRYPGMSISVWQEHDRILTETIRGDADGAAALMRRHVVDAYKRVQKVRDAFAS